MTFWQSELIRLESVAAGLCFGRLDMRDSRRVYVGRLGLFRDEDDTARRTGLPHNQGRLVFRPATNRTVPHSGTRTLTTVSAAVR